MQATTRGALLRGSSTTDALGDEIEDDSEAAVVPGFADFPLSAIERGRREQDPASGTWRTIRYYVGRVPANVPAAAGDRIRDREGNVYTIDEVNPVKRSISGRSSRTLSMRRT